MGLKKNLITDQEAEGCIAEKIPEKLVRDRRHLDLLDKIKQLPKGRIHPANPQLKGLERARRKLEKHLIYHDDDCEYDVSFIDKGELKIGHWWSGIREEYSDLNTGETERAEIV